MRQRTNETVFWEAKEEGGGDSGAGVIRGKSLAIRRAWVTTNIRLQIRLALIIADALLSYCVDYL